MKSLINGYNVNSICIQSEFNQDAIQNQFTFYLDATKM